MKYIALLYGEPGAGPAPGTPEFMQMLGEFQSVTTAMTEAGILVDSGPLQPPQTATTVRVRDGEIQLSDGPFAEIKEQLGGYYILDCEDLDMALFTHRVRITAASDLDDELRGWIATAYALAG